MRLRILFFVLCVCCAPYVKAQSDVKVVEDSLFSISVNAYMKFYAILPEHYNDTQERYTTLYLLHGYTGNYSDWVRFTELVKYAKQYNFIIITPDGRNSWYCNSPTVKNNNFEDYIMKEIISFVDKKYRTIATRHGRAIAGLSMGGYGALKFAIKYPETFFYCASLSGAIHLPATMNLIIQKRPSEYVQSLKTAFGENKNEFLKNDVFTLIDSVSIDRLPYLYLSVGHNDGIPEIIEYSNLFSTTLRKKKAAYEFHETIGEHNWIFWDKEIEIVLQKIERYQQSNY